MTPCVFLYGLKCVRPRKHQSSSVSITRSLLGAVLQVTLGYLSAREVAELARTRDFRHKMDKSHGTQGMGTRNVKNR